MLFGIVGCAGNTSSTGGTYKAGTYTATAKGNNGDVKVSVTFSGEKITEVKLDEHRETPGIGDTAFNTISAKIVEGQTLNVDTVSGATNSSNAILEAVKNCVEQAGGDVNALMTQANSEPTKTEQIKSEQTDILVIGAGAAGLTASYFARTAGKNVILLEKRAFTGGNSALAGKFDLGGSKFQEKMGVDFSAEDHYESVAHEVGVEIGKTADEEYIRNFTSKGGAYLDWLVDEIKIPAGKVTNGKEIYSADGSGIKLTAEAMTMLTDAVKKIGVDLRLENAATKLVTKDGKVVGAEVKGPNGTYTINASAIIMTSGGFAASKELLEKYAPTWAGTPTSNTSATTGDGIIMAQEVGAVLSNMESFTLNPTFYDNNGTTISVSGVRYNGGILVDTKGKRFANELGDYTKAALAELALPEKGAFGIMDSKGLGTKAEYCVQADTIEELAAKIGVDPKGLAETIAKYHDAYDKKAEDEFGREDMRSRLDTAPYYAIKVFPGIHNTHGGITVNTRAQALGTTGKPIPGLYAAGDVADVKLYGAEALTAAGVYGRIAAESAITDIK
ncbi:FAD-dependent oxidoreductase [Oxobacter pfennigii]|nr:FAD-dependent oxidoreductase [Oxobacter pfennigii]